MDTPQPKYDSAKETSRIESFSDGVFAIAITLLVLDIRVPDLNPNESLLKSLLVEWPSFLALLIGFFTLLICWINHHYMFQLIHRSNSMLLLINGFKLLIVTITPFATALLSKHIQTDWENSAVTIYCFNFALMGIAMTGVWIYSYKKGFAGSISDKVLISVTKLYIFAGIFSTMIWIVSFFSIILCMVLFGIMFLIFLFPKRVVNWLTIRNK